MESEIFNEKWSYPYRSEFIDRLKKEHFELLIIGGGMTGAGVLRESALRGIKAALIDKADFAFGTSSRSSKLAHGGIRYLKNLEFKLVRESTTERNWLRVHFPNLVRPVAFNYCAHKGGKDKKIHVKAAMFLYQFLSDFLSKYKNYKKYRLIKPEEFKKEEPAYRSEDLIIVGQYYDTNIDDARLTLETIKECVIIGDSVAVNYVKCIDFIKNGNGRITGVKAEDVLSGETFEIIADKVINATGIWTDEILKNYPRKIIRPTKGVHVIVPAEKVGNINAFGLRSIDDQRVFFVIPREEFTLIGTTDTDYKGDLDAPFCNKEDCDYLFRTVNIRFPNAKLTYDDIISTYAGIRPLVREEGKSESDVSRKHIIFDTEDGLTTIVGGKLTIFRKMGEDTLFHILKKGELKRKLPKKMKKKGYSKRPFIIGLKRSEWEKYLAEHPVDGLEERTLDMLYQQYGKGAFKILEMLKEHPEWSEKIIPENHFIVAEIRYILKYEMAVKLMDVMCRRTEMQMKIKHTRQREAAEKVAEIMAEVYGWTDEKKNAEIEEYMDYIKKTIWF